MEPIHLRSSIAQSQEVSRLQKVAENIDDMGRQLLSITPDGDRVERLEPSSEAEKTRLAGNRHQSGRDRSDKEERKGSRQETGRQPDHPSDDADSVKGRHLDLLI